MFLLFWYVFVILNCEFSRWNGKNVRRTKRGRHRRGANIYFRHSDPAEKMGFGRIWKIYLLIWIPKPFLRFFISRAGGQDQNDKKGLWWKVDFSPKDYVFVILNRQIYFSVIQRLSRNTMFSSFWSCLLRGSWRIWKHCFGETLL